MLLYSRHEGGVKNIAGNHAIFPLLLYIPLVQVTPRKCDMTHILITLAQARWTKKGTAECPSTKHNRCWLRSVPGCAASWKVPLGQRPLGTISPISAVLRLVISRIACYTDTPGWRIAAWSCLLRSVVDCATCVDASGKHFISF